MIDATWPWPFLSSRQQFMLRRGYIWAGEDIFGVRQLQTVEAACIVSSAMLGLLIGRSIAAKLLN